MARATCTEKRHYATGGPAFGPSVAFIVAGATVFLDEARRALRAIAPAAPTKKTAVRACVRRLKPYVA